MDTAAHLCRADQAVIFRLDDGLLSFASGHGINPVHLDIEQRTPIAPGQGTVVGRAAMNKRVVRIDDAWSDPLYEKKEDAKTGGVRSMIGVPLMRQDQPIGVITLARARVEPFADREIELVSTFADQAVIAIENVRLFEAEQQRTAELTELLEQQTATADVLRVISSSARQPATGVLDHAGERGAHLRCQIRQYLSVGWGRLVPDGLKQRPCRIRKGARAFTKPPGCTNADRANDRHAKSSFM